MRIRKRKVPLPLSLLSPVPLTDPHLFSRSPVQPPADDDNNNNNNNNTPPTCSSDHFTTPTCCSDTSASDLLLRLAATPTHASLPLTGVDEGVQISNNDDASNATITTTRCAPAYRNNDNSNNNHHRPLPLPLSNNEGRWCDGDRAIPLKKRRTMIMKCDLESKSNIGKKDDEVKSTVTSDQTSVVINDDNNGNDNRKQEVVAVAATSAKKGNSKRGNTIMEGSRCSRVNGRGWRCCQPTLVGYSLCEHHLGKGRLRSMASTAKARSSSSTKKNANSNNNSFAIGDHEDREKVDSKNNNEKKMERMSSFGNNSSTSKRAKLGVVKARSLSSLLGQTNTMNNNIVGDHANVQQQTRINN